MNAIILALFLGNVPPHLTDCSVVNENNPEFFACKDRMGNMVYTNDRRELTPDEVKKDKEDSAERRRKFIDAFEASKEKRAKEAILAKTKAECTRYYTWAVERWKQLKQTHEIERDKLKIRVYKFPGDNDKINAQQHIVGLAEKYIGIMQKNLETCDE